MPWWAAHDDQRRNAICRMSHFDVRDRMASCLDRRSHHDGRYGAFDAHYGTFAEILQAEADQPRRAERIR